MVVTAKRKSAFVAAAACLLLITQIGCASADPEPHTSGIPTTGIYACPLVTEIPVRDLQNQLWLDCELEGVLILFDDGRTMATPPTGEVATGMPARVAGSESLEKISVANLGPGIGVVGLVENAAHEVSYWGPTEATAIVKERKAEAISGEP